MNLEPADLPAENEYPKLIRDNILNIIKNKTGAAPEHRVLADDEEFLAYLLKKFVEEATELRHSIKNGNMEEELADILELVATILRLKNWTLADIENIQREKSEKNGGFEKRLLMLNR